ncbi:MAG TPA: hypothetical protein PLK38_06220 [Methanoregulaceae archaeon]|nr:hypothetical protein [Methanoregulaceae archaeon]
MKDPTSILIHKPTLSRLKSVGKMGDSYDRVINRLIDLYQNSRENTNGE